MIRNNEQYDQSIDQAALSQYHKRLTLWGQANFRAFPWRTTRNPYCVFIAEVLLHRTQVKQVFPVYSEFILRYTSPQALCRASVSEVQACLKGLGLTWRVELLIAAIEEVVCGYGGHFPQDRKSLENLPGVGHYIASCVLCFAYGKPVAVVDTNTVRVISRVVGFQLKDGLRRNKSFHRLANRLIDSINPRKYNFALFDLAHTHCKQRYPLCETCPIRALCVYSSTSSKFLLLQT